MVCSLASVVVVYFIASGRNYESIKGGAGIAKQHFGGETHGTPNGLFIPDGQNQNTRHYR